MQLPSLQTLDPNTIYDVIMEQIDPRLTHKNMGDLQEEFEGLDKDGIQQKHGEIKDSLKKYEKVKNAYFVKIHEEIEALKHEKHEKAEVESKKDEEEVLAKLEAMFS
jgi:hypothetical protein